MSNDERARFRREEIAAMTQTTLVQLVSSRPGQITGEMIRANAEKTRAACEAIFDCCEVFRMSPDEREQLAERERIEAEKAEKAEKKAADKALKDAKDQEKKNAAARDELAKIEAARARRHEGGGSQ